ncbi:hypothetical protein CC1G_13344 [Coprinopsis cinerea okayama7|uniref:Uncharacterized protein n=1 Tax=Coprinopsis cinerea (strain Okayama-7 / 130 / ATCC MYA-4618 / FGSC 9003) TaxID=240176 RepID=A8PIJ3_COPC7|nr:hypothetical protein CC1G_13344 [Coprinopsis cinerea okayama7\|eukprot:XP_001841580.1 hypothetical protein CC1G_13344 [Coprinopsis cinerea okayama7\
MHLICALPSIDKTGKSSGKLVPYEGSFMYTREGVQVLCRHAREKDPRSPAIQPACAALAAFDLYWLSELGCAVSLSHMSVVVKEELSMCLKVHKELAMFDSQIAYNHIAEHFPLATLEELLPHWLTTTVTYPIPGLALAEKRYQCPECKL